MAALDNDVFFATAAELNARLIKKEFSAEELARAFAERLEQLGPLYNALALPLKTDALRQARAVDKDIKRERLRGPLQGVPYAVKDLLSYAGQPTTWGAKPYAAQVFDFNATVIEKLNDAGSVITGKLSMVELAGGGGYRFASASLFGPGLNPWDRTRWAGGSSSGSAAAVAAGLAPFTIGSETSGSIVTPAAFCGVTALRPTYGLVSRHGAMALSWTLDKLGPFAHTAEDCGLILHAIAGKDGKDPGSAGKSFYYTPQYARPLSELRIGFAAADFADRPEVEARPAFAAALDTLKACGIQLMEAKLPPFPYGTALAAILGAEQASVFEPLISSGRVDELADQAQIAGLKASLEIPAKDYLRAMRIRRLMQDAIHLMWSDLDAVVAPARTGVAPKIDEPLSPPPAAASSANRTAPPPSAPAGFGAIIPAGNLAGLPALVLPCGFAGNLPLAVQLVGPPWSENTLLAVGKEFQSRTDWHKRRPPAV
ncbi:MAG TPA: amidase [Bryobacteraceae bacterium]|jgi:aspartyl-tRNA(Asn)/glutamyl-tRNA(Gln) amidotransferase subunit A